MAGSDSTRSGAMATGGPGGVQNEASGNRKRHLVEKYEKKKKKKKKNDVIIFIFVSRQVQIPPDLVPWLQGDPVEFRMRPREIGNGI